jgi:type II secretory pathway pseudopilin PulG
MATDQATDPTTERPVSTSTPKRRRGIELKLELPDWHPVARLRRLTGTQRLMALLLVALVAVSSWLGYQKYQEAQTKQRQAAYAAEMVLENKNMEAAATDWANYNAQTLIDHPSELRNMLPAHTGWATKQQLSLTKDGVVVLPTQLKLYPKPPSGVESLLVSRLLNMNTYVVFRFVSCGQHDAPLVAAPAGIEGISAVQQPFSLVTPKCPYK